MKKKRLYALLFAILTAMKLLLPYVPKTQESGGVSFLLKSDLTELAEALCRKMTGEDNVVEASAQEQTGERERGRA